MSTLEIKNIGQIKEARVVFGDLTVLVGSQATGKSLFLQMYKLTQDIGHIKSQLGLYGFNYDSFESFLSLYFGEGMENIWGAGSEVKVENEEFDLKENLDKSHNSKMKNLYIPAQRVLMMEYGFAKPFTGFDISYPYVLKEFSELIRFELDKYFSNKNDVFPQPNKLRSELSHVISKHIYRDATIKIKSIGSKKQLVMDINGKSFPVGSWSAGQKEFAPLLFGLYWALSAANVTKRDRVTTITIEEPEMGLHPNAIVDTMLLVMELLSRGYKVNISTHSNTILELFWAINEIKKNRKKVDAKSIFLDIFGLDKTESLREFAETILKKNFNIYYFENDIDNKTIVKDISNLDINSEKREENEWGEITSFSSRVSEVISKIYGEI